MKTTLAIIVTLAIAATSADTLMAAATTPELSSLEVKEAPARTRHEGAFRPISHAPSR